MSDYARKLIGIEALNADQASWTGRDEVIAVIDSGIDADHPDFAGRLRHVTSGVAGGNEEDLIGHGTHVAGTAVGSGSASGGKIRGMAPEAQLVVIGITDDDGLLCRPPDLGDLLRQAADQGARVINLSWQTPLAGAYDSGAREVDTFVRERPDVLVVVAAGNEGRAPDGYPYLYSVGTPATAKNALTIGASASSRPDIVDTYGSYSSTRFPAVPTSAHYLAGDPTFVAAFSSRGPSDFQSVKPDLVAPGTAILAPRASKAPKRRFWRECPEYGGQYGFMNGTSMAAPVVSGAALVVRQLIRQEYGLIPSAAMLKALLVASTRPLPWRRQQEMQDSFGYPDFDQGFGRLDLTAALPGAHAPASRKMWLEDVPSDDVRALESRSPVGALHKAARRYRFALAEGESQPLRVTMAWTDYSEAAVQNCLSLDLQGPDLRMRGNSGHRWQMANASWADPKYIAAAIDRRNNVQDITLSAARPGNYTLTVFASNTLFPPQGFSLCISGSLESNPVIA
jgi:serine protease AprX